MRCAVRAVLCHLSVELCCATSPSPTCAHGPCARARLPVCADYPQIEVFDTTELKSLETLLAQERERVVELRAKAKEQQRKVLRVNCDLDLKRIERLETWIFNAVHDGRRTW